MSKAGWASRLRYFLSTSVVFFCFAYTASLTLSGAAVEITSAGLVFFMLLTGMAHKWGPPSKLEWHTLGIEVPLLLFAIALAAGLVLNSSQEGLVHGAREAGLLIYRLALMLITLTVALQLVRNLNALFITLVILGFLVASYGIWQHFTGMDLIRHITLNLADEGSQFFKSQGLFRSPLTFAHSLMMVACLPWAAFILGSHLKWWQRLAALAIFLVIVLAIVFSYGRGAWIALIVTLPMMAVFVSRKAFLSVAIGFIICFAVVYKINPELKTKLLHTFSESAKESEDKRLLWEINVDMFKEHPWVGVGYKQNEFLAPSYYSKLNISGPSSGHSHSNYIEFLATTGLLGFFSYMLFLLAFILMTARLLSSIPSTHFWHKVIVLAALGAQLAFHVGGLTHRNFGDDIVLHQFLFWLAVIGYMSQRYYAHIVPDDRSI